MTVTADPVAATEATTRAAQPARRVNRGTQIGLLLGAFVVVFAVGRFATPTWLEVVNQSLLACIGALALNLVLGHTGLVSVGNAAFMAMGALVSAELAIKVGLSFPLAVIGGGLGAALTGIPVAIPSFRIRGLYLAASTLAFQFIMVFVMQKIQQAQLGSAGSGFNFPRASLFGWHLRSVWSWYVFLVPLIVVMVLFQRGLLRGKPGRAWHAIREHEDIAVISGVAVRRYKVWSMVVSSFFVGIQGALLAYYVGNADYQTYTLALGINFLAMVVLGGMGSLYGPIIGAFLVTGLGRVTQAIATGIGVGTGSAQVTASLVQASLIGLLIVVIILVEPNGVAALAVRVYKRVAELANRRTSGRPGEAT
jgi:branched-chain amino acid transport system permease protein